MVETQEEEKVYNWDVMEIGHTATPLTVEVTKERIANYAKSVRDDNPIFFDEAAAKAAGFDGIVAPPTMLYVYSPMRRAEIMNGLGYVSPEQSKESRSTPFAGTEVMFQGVPVLAGDTITSQPTVDRKWESSSGNRFVSFRIIATNQRGEKVVEYLYNVIWEYAQGQKSRNG